jgi:chromosome segregation ATPase
MAAFQLTIEQLQNERNMYCKELTKAIEESKSQSIKSQQDLDAKSKELDTALSSILRMQNTQEEARRDKEKSVQDVVGKLKKEQEHIAQIHSTLQKREAENSFLMKRIKELEKVEQEKVSLILEYSNISQDDLEAKLQEQKDLVQKLKAEIDSLTKQWKDSQQQLKDLTEKQEKAKDVESQRDLLHEKVHGLEKEKDDLKKWNEQLEAASQNVQDQLKEKAQDLDKLKEQFKDLEKRLAETQSAKYPR